MSRNIVADEYESINGFYARLTSNLTNAKSERPRITQVITTFSIYSEEQSNNGLGDIRTTSHHK